MTRELSVGVSGMECAACALRLERALSKLDGVDHASVNFATCRATVTTDRIDLSRSSVEEVVLRSGFGVDPTFPSTTQNVHASRGEGSALLTKAMVATVAGMMMMGFAELDLPPLGLWIVLAVATPIQFWAGSSFYVGAYRAWQQRALDMNSLIVFGATAAYLVSAFVTVAPTVAATVGLQNEIYYEPALMIIGLVLLGRVLERSARARMSVAIENLMNLAPPVATLVRPDGDQQVACDALQVGDLVRVRPSEAVPVDGVIEQGASTLDESMVTGESIPVDKRGGDAVIGGTRNLQGSFVFRVRKVRGATLLDEIARAVELAQSRKAPVQRIADAIAGWFVPAVLLLASLTFVAWFFLNSDPQRLALAIRYATSVLVVACPCALGLATPTAVLVGLGHAAERGILFRGGDSLELARKATSVVFDKTGTLTRGQFEVAHVEGLDDETLRLVAAVEQGSQHPLAEAIVSYVRSRGLDFPTASGFAATHGMGAQALVLGRRVRAGDAKFMEQARVSVVQFEAAARGCWNAGQTVVYVAVDARCVGFLALHDTVRAEAASLVGTLRRRGVDVWMLSGDAPVVAQGVAKLVGIAEHNVRGGLLPSDKEAEIRALQAKGHVVAMVGDGVNDAPALAQSDIGMAIGAGEDIAKAASDITLLGDNLESVVRALQLSDRAVRIIRQNLVWAFAYNALLIPVAMGILVPAFGVALTPLMAALAMSLSSVSVVLNSLRLRYDRPAEFLRGALLALGRLDGGYTLSTHGRRPPN